MIIRVTGSTAIVRTERSPQGAPVPLKDLQHAMDLLRRDGAVAITPDVLGHRSSFIAAVLLTLPGARVTGRPAVLILDRLDETPHAERGNHGIDPDQSHGTPRERVRGFERDSAAMAGTEGPVIDDDSLEATERCFFHESQWWFRIDVKSDALQGLAVPVPPGAMRIFKVTRGTERMFFDKDAVPLRVSWMRKQPSLGSIRNFLMARRANVGDAMWLTLSDTERLKLRLSRQPRCPSDADVLAHLAGAESTADLLLLRRQVANALGRRDAESWDRISVILHTRGDADAAELAANLARGQLKHPPSFDDFLDSLRRR